MTWWNCLLCKFKMPDDGSVEAARRMGKHIEEHEREEPEQKERAFRKWLADGHPGVLLPHRKHTEVALRQAFETVGLVQALKNRQISLAEFGERLRKLESVTTEERKMSRFLDCRLFEPDVPKRGA